MSRLKMDAMNGIAGSSMTTLFQPTKDILDISRCSGLDITSEEFAIYMDNNDPLRHLREEFHIPKNKNFDTVDTSLVDPEECCVYFCGNSLGLQPKSCKRLVNEELDKWERKGVHGHFQEARPWMTIDEFVVEKSARVVGAKPIEVAVMNSLTVNLHLLMVPFYRPTTERHKIMIEAKAFPSDHFAMESQIRHHGFDPATSLLQVHPREGEDILRTEDILDIIKKEGSSIAVIMFSGVQFYTGQFFDIQAISQAGHNEGCVVGFDLAHAAGNINLKLHDWDVDFACWCCYKYMNSGPGAVAGAFIHERHAYNFNLSKFAGWWGDKVQTRFNMTNEFNQMPGAAGYQISNPPVLQTVALLASLDVFEQTTMDDLKKKSELLTGYLEYLILHYYPPPVKSLNQERKHSDEEQPYAMIITPKDPKQRGCQLSVQFSVPVSSVCKELEKRGCIVDKREPDVLRVAPTPLYNKFHDIFRFVRLLGKSMEAAGANKKGT